jgi:hypothetical protein
MQNVAALVNETGFDHRAMNIEADISFHGVLLLFGAGEAGSFGIYLFELKAHRVGRAGSQIKKGLVAHRIDRPAPTMNGLPDMPAVIVFIEPETR